MKDYIESKAVLVKKKIEEDFKELDGKDLERFFDRFQNDKRTLSFINYYNKTVLDREKIKFSTFGYQWALHLTRKFYTFFDENHDSMINEIKNKKKIRDFHNSFCIDNLGKRRGSFCSKLFHTVLPSEFPPVDNAIRKRFELNNEDFITSVLIIKMGYELYIKDNQEKINLFRKILSKDKFSYLRINELSNIRILDMFYWFKENREGGLSDASHSSKSLHDFLSIRIGTS